MSFHCYSGSKRNIDSNDGSANAKRGIGLLLDAAQYINSLGSTPYQGPTINIKCGSNQCYKKNEQTYKEPPTPVSQSPPVTKNGEQGVCVPPALCVPVHDPNLPPNPGSQNNTQPFQDKNTTPQSQQTQQAQLTTPTQQNQPNQQSQQSQQSTQTGPTNPQNPTCDCSPKTIAPSALPWLGDLSRDWTSKCSQPPPPIAPVCNENWTKVALEGQSFTFNENVDLAYGPEPYTGTNDNYRYNVQGTVIFNNATFGDPAVNQIKAGFYRCATGINPPPPPEPPVDPGTGGLIQYTPSYTQATNIGAPCIEAGTQAANWNKGHDPDGINWISRDNWRAAEWDGVKFNPCGKTTAQICAFCFPSYNTMRGLRELYYSQNPLPFQDPKHPTIAEVDNWNVKVVQHFRDLIGAPVKVVPSKCEFLRAHWSNERQWTRVWDTKYPTDTCLNFTNPHCGAGFIPSCADQQPYLNGGPCCTSTAGAEGIFTTKTDLPWSIKLARVIADTVCREGLSGHSGPFVGREYMGLSFVCMGASTVVRAKWSGRLEGISCP